MDGAFQTRSGHDLKATGMTFHDHEYPVTALAYSPDGHFLASGDTERQVRVRSDGGSLREWSFDSTWGKLKSMTRMRSLAFSPDGGYLYVSARDAVEAIYTDSGSEAWYYQPPRAWGFLVVSPLRVAVSKQGMIASTFDNGSIGVWSCAGNRSRLWQEPESPIWIGWLQDGEHLAGADGFHVQKWDWRSRTRVFRWSPEEKIFSFSVHPTEDTAAIRTLHEMLLFDLGKEKLIARYPAPMGLPLVAFRPNHLELAVCGLGYAMVYNYGGGEVARFYLDGRRATAVAWTQDGEALAVGCADGTVTVFLMSGAKTELSEVFTLAPSA